MTSEFAVAVHALVFLNHKGGDSAQRVPCGKCVY